MTDTREAFERHFKPTIRQQKRHMNGDYRDPDIQAKWLGWQAGIASAAVQEPCARIYIHPQSLAMRQVPIYDAQSFEAESPHWEHHGDIFFKAAV